MAVVAKIEPVADFVNLVVNEDLSPRAQQAAIAGFARQRLTEAQRANQRTLGRVPQHKTFVDGRRGAPLESVRPRGGTIVFEFELVTDALRAIAQMLVDRSPVRSGEYVRGHRLFADGIEVAVGAAGVVPEAEEYTFLNLVPYARKIEIGKTRSGRAFVIQVPNRIYERTALDARRRFGNLFKITFSYRAAIGGVVRGRSRRADGRTPAIIVSLR